MDDSENGDMVLTTSFSGSATEEQNNDEKQFSGSAFTDNSISQGLGSILITLKPSRWLYFLEDAGHAAQTLGYASCDKFPSFKANATQLPIIFISITGQVLQ